jgi:hypothetical protein
MTEILGEPADQKRSAYGQKRENYFQARLRGYPMGTLGEAMPSEGEIIQTNEPAVAPLCPFKRRTRA